MKKDKPKNKKKVFEFICYIFEGVRKAQIESRNKLSKYLSVFEEFLSDSIIIEGNIENFYEGLDQNKIEIRYIENSCKTPDYLGLRYLFDYGSKPSRLYKNIPKNKSINDEKKYDVCFLNEQKQVIRIVESYCIVPRETLIIHNNQTRLEVTFEKREKGNVIIYYSKSQMDFHNNIITIKEVNSLNRGKSRKKYMLNHNRIDWSTILIDTYHISNGKLYKCDFYECKPFGFTNMLMPKRPNDILWIVSEKTVCIVRDGNQMPVKYNLDWQYSGGEIFNQVEEHTITKKQAAKITKLELLFDLNRK